MRKMLLALPLIWFSIPAASAEEIFVAAAADLSFVFPELAAGFEKESGHRLRLSFGSSGNLFSQIENGAPFDLYFSADSEYPRRLEATGQVEPGTLYPYALGRMVLWVPSGSRLDVGRGLGVLLDPAVGKIAIANPRHAPYGRAAVAALEHARLYAGVQSKLVFGENISQAAQFVESGNADVGILALSLVVAPAMKHKGRYFEIPPGDYPPLEQACVLLKSSQHKPAARLFLEYLRTPETIALLTRYGFTPPRDAAGTAQPVRETAPPREKP
jgi:molybdate transport system substrate-binding protein